MLDIFTESVARIPGVGTADLHHAHRSAKLLRRRIEAGRRPTEADWSELFPDPAVMRLAQIHLDEGPGTPAFDPEATLAPGCDGESTLGRRHQPSGDDDEAVAVEKEAWYAFLSELPDEGLPSNGRPDERIDTWTLGRMIVGVSRGMATVDFDELPAADGFRQRFLSLARRTGRLECILGLPLSA